MEVIRGSVADDWGRERGNVLKAVTSSASADAAASTSQMR